MCRLAAFPPMFDPEEALGLLQTFAYGNKDGTGSVYVKDGEFVVNKWPVPLYRAKDRALLSHMPYPGWTVVHLRAASHGGNTYENTHPFVKGDYAVVHNGIWPEYALVKETLKGASLARAGGPIKWDGETDSEVAAYIFANSGPKKFARVMEACGTFLGLHRSGELWAVKTATGAMELLMLPGKNRGILIASAIWDEDAIDPEEGWFRFNTKGELIQRGRVPMACKYFGDVEEIESDDKSPPEAGVDLPRGGAEGSLVRGYPFSAFVKKPTAPRYGFKEDLPW